MRATQNLPATYQEAGTIDIKKDQRLMVILNLAGIVMLGMSGWFFYRAFFWLRPINSFQGIQFISIHSLGDLAGVILAVLGLTALNVILHEAVHGLFFWIFTHTRPRFAFHWVYAYAAAPDWYLPRNEFLVTALAPLVLISLVGLVVIKTISPAWLLATWFVLTMNAAGAVGDILVAGWLWRHTPAGFIQDRGDAVTLYLPGNNAG